MQTMDKEKKDIWENATRRNLVLNFSDGTQLDNDDISSESMTYIQSLCDESALKYGLCNSASFTTKIFNTSKSFKGLYVEPVLKAIQDVEEEYREETTTSLEDKFVFGYTETTASGEIIDDYRDSDNNLCYVSVDTELTKLAQTMGATSDNGLITITTDKSTIKEVITDSDYGVALPKPTEASNTYTISGKYITTNFLGNTFGTLMVALADSTIEDAKITYTVTVYGDIKTRTVSTSYDFPLGKFLVTSDERTSDRKYKELKCYDAMYEIANTDMADWYSGLTFPITLRDFRYSFFNQFGLSQVKHLIPLSMEKYILKEKGRTFVVTNDDDEARTYTLNGKIENNGDVKNFTVDNKTVTIDDETFLNKLSNLSSDGAIIFTTSGRLNGISYTDGSSSAGMFFGFPTLEVTTVKRSEFKTDTITSMTITTSVATTSLEISLKEAFGINIYDSVDSTTPIKTIENTVSPYDDIDISDVEVTIDSNASLYMESIGKADASLTIGWYYDYLPNDAISIAKTVNPSTLTGKDVIQAICELNGCFGQMTTDNKFKYVYISSDEDGLTPSDTLYPDDELYPQGATDIDYSMNDYTQNGLTYQDYVCQPVSAIHITESDSDVGGQYPTELGDNPYTISSNFLILGDSTQNKNIYAQNIYNEIKNVKFTPCTLKAWSKPWVELGDCIGIATTDGYIESVVLKKTMSGIQACYDSFEAKGTETFSENTQTLSTSIEQLRGRTNELIRTVDETTSQITKLEDGDTLVSIINQTAESVTINANRINLEGVVTANDLKGEGTTVINGANITTGTISVGGTDTNSPSINVYNTDGTLIGSWTEDGIDIEQGTIKASTGFDVNVPTNTSGVNYLISSSNDSLKVGIFDSQEGRSAYLDCGFDGKGIGNITFTGQVYLNEICNKYVTNGLPITSGNIYDLTLMNGTKSSYVYGSNTQGAGYDFAIATSEASDKALKDNIKSTEVVALDTIDELDFVQFDWNENTILEGHEELGLIANDLENIIPDAVINTTPDKEGGRKVRDYPLIMYSMKAIQELSEKIKEQEERIAKLEQLLAEKGE